MFLLLVTFPFRWSVSRFVRSAHRTIWAAGGSFFFLGKNRVADFQSNHLFLPLFVTEFDTPDLNHCFILFFCLFFWGVQNTWRFSYQICLKTCCHFHTHTCSVWRVFFDLPLFNQANPVDVSDLFCKEGLGLKAT